MTIDQPTDLWKVMFLSKGMIVPTGERRMREMKLRHIGKRMKMTSTWQSSAEARAIATNNIYLIAVALERRLLTEPKPEHMSRIVQVILVLVVQET